MLSHLSGKADLADQLLQSLKVLGPDWHSRSEIAKQWGKSRLTAWEISLLNYLIETEKVELRVVRRSNGMPIYEYKVK